MVGNKAIIEESITAKMKNGQEYHNKQVAIYVHSDSLRNCYLGLTRFPTIFGGGRRAGTASCSSPRPSRAGSTSSAPTGKLFCHNSCNSSIFSL